MIILEEDYLEHFGKKGMRWGHRKKTDTIDNNRYSSPKVGMSRNKKLAIGIGIGVAAAGAVAFLARDTPIGKMAQSSVRAGSRVAARQLAKDGQMKAARLRQVAVTSARIQRARVAEANRIRNVLSINKQLARQQLGPGLGFLPNKPPPENSNRR